MNISKLLSDPAVVTDRRYESVMRAFEEVSLATSHSDSSLEAVLGLVGERLCQLLGVNRCSVYLRDEEQGLFRGHAAWCDGRDLGPQVRALLAGVPGDGFTEEILSTRGPVLVNDAQSDPRPLHDAMRRWRVRDMLGIPLLVENDVIGIIFVDNQDEPHEYTRLDIKLAQALAGLTATALRQARLFAELEQRTALIEHQQTQLKRISAADHCFARAVLEGADTQTLLDHLKRLLALPVLLYSDELALLGWSCPTSVKLAEPPALTARSRVDPLLVEELRRLAREGKPGVISTPASTARRRLVCPLRIENGHAGFLEVVELGGRLHAEDAKIVERAAMAVSLELLAERRKADSEGLARQDYLADLLHGPARSTEQLRRRGPLVGLDPTQPHVVIRVVYAHAPGSEPGSQRRAQLEEEVRRLLGHPTSLLSTGAPDADMVVVGLDARLTLLAIESALRAGFDELVTVGVDRVIVSGVCRDLGRLPAASAEVRDVGRLLGSLGSDCRVLATREVGMLRFLGPGDGLEAAQVYVRRLLHPLVEDDAGEGSTLATLTAFVANGGRVRAAAQELGVHENTVRYRIGRIRDQHAIDLADQETLAEMTMALRLERLCGSSGEVPRGSCGL